VVTCRIDTSTIRARSSVRRVKRGYWLPFKRRNECNARKALSKKKYAVKIKSTQETQAIGLRHTRLHKKGCYRVHTGNLSPGLEGRGGPNRRSGVGVSYDALTHSIDTIVKYIGSLSRS